MKELIVAPSILSMDYAKTSEQLKQLDESKAKWMHFDVMDGHFVPNLTFGPDLLKGFKNAVNMVMDVHIMVADPVYFAQMFAHAGADVITFHIEALETIEACIALCKQIRKMGAMAGISFKPKTEVEGVLAYLKDIDLILIMSVEPGFGGQSFIPEVLDKVRILRKEIDDRRLDTRIEIDGGINADTAKQAVAAGCDTLVAGSYIFHKDIKEAIETLLCQK